MSSTKICGHNDACLFAYCSLLQARRESSRSLQGVINMLSHTGESTPFLQHQSYVSLYKKAPWYRKKTFYLNLIRRSMAELLSTALFVFVAVSSFINVGMDSCLASSATTVALVHGLAYAALMAANRHVRYMEYCIHISSKLLTWEYIYGCTCMLVV